MSDLRLFYNAELLSADVGIEGRDLAMDNGLETAIVVSLFTDRRAKPDDELPAGADDDRRGWWGDALAENGDRIGSRLWLLSREKQLPSVVARIKEYVREALQWTITDGIAIRVEVDAGIYSPGVCWFSAWLVEPNGNRINFKYHYEWEAQKARSVSA